MKGGHIIRPELQPGWSQDVEAPGPDDELGAEYDAQRGLVMLRYQRGRTGIPYTVPVPLHEFLSLAGQLMVGIYTRPPGGPKA